MEPHLILFPSDSSSPYCIDLDLGTPSDVVEIQYPFRWKRIKVLGSCRGLLCISKANDREVAIWNPFTGRYKLLPPADTEIGGGLYPSACVHGFGYDDRNDDYVLLRLVQTFQEPIESAVSIYSLRANAWRQLKEMSYSLVNTRKRGIFLHGRLHWIMTPQLVPNSEKKLVAFDIHSDKFVEVGKLNFIDNGLDMDLTILGGYLHLIIYGEQRGVHAWIMREYGLNGPWHMLFSMLDHSRPSGLVWPLAYSQNGCQVLVALDGKTLVWYDLHTGGVERFNIRCMPSSFEAEICLRTLVPIDKLPI